MRLIKMFGLAALAAVAAMAFVGAASASFDTRLCTNHESLTCNVGASSVHMTLEAGTVWKLLSTFITVLCLEALMEAAPLGLGNPQEVHSTALTFGGCGTNSGHNNCEVTVIVQPLWDLLKTGLDAGTLTALGGLKFLKCEEPDILCLYVYTGVQLGFSAQHLTANKTPITEEGSKFLCPDKPTLDGLLKTLTNAYVLQ